MLEQNSSYLSSTRLRGKDVFCIYLLLMKDQKRKTRAAARKLSALYVFVSYLFLKTHRHPQSHLSFYASFGIEDLVLVLKLHIKLSCQKQEKVCMLLYMVI